MFIPDTHPALNSFVNHRLFQLDVLSSIPSLIGLKASTTAAMPTDTSSPPSPASWSNLRPVLGLNTNWPKGLEERGALKCFLKSDFKKAEANRPAGPRGPHLGKENHAQGFFEDVRGVTVSGERAESARNVRHPLFESVRWTGQAAPSWSVLSHEARAFIYERLGTMFPELLLCSDGVWKMDELCSDSYSQWIKKYPELTNKGIASAGGDPGPATKKRKIASTGSNGISPPLFQITNAYRINVYLRFLRPGYCGHTYRPGYDASACGCRPSKGGRL